MVPAGTKCFKTSKLDVGPVLMRQEECSIVLPFSSVVLALEVSGTDSGQGLPI